MAIPSPYTPGSAPRVFSGRHEQLDAAQRDLALVATYGRFIGRIRIETGIRGVGKTSLLNAVRQEAGQAGFVTIFATARQDESLIAQLTEALRRGLDQIGISAATARDVRNRIERMSIEVGIGVIKAGVQLAARPPATGAAATAFSDLLQVASHAARDRGSAGLCLLIDEIQSAPPADLRTIAYAWQELSAATRDSPAVLFAAGLPNTPDVLTQAATFSERFAFRSLERLSDAEAYAVLLDAATDVEVNWQPRAARRVVDLAQGYPYYLQLFGDAMWQVARPTAGATLTMRHYEQAAALVSKDMAGMFRARWSRATVAERRILSVMAELGGETIRRADAAERLGVHSNDLSVARRGLIDKGIVEPAGRGALRFTTPGFAEFVRAEDSD